MKNTQHYNELKNLVLNEGMAVFGAGDISGIREHILIPNNLAERFSTGLSFGYRLSQGVLDSLTGAPNQLYYFHYQRVNQLLDQTALKLTSLIQKNGFQALPIPASQVTDWVNQLGTVNHREVARLAGLGWYGRNNLLVNPEYGSQVRYATVLTDMPIKLDKPVTENCGSCKTCVTLCPAKAIGEDKFELSLCREKLKDFVKTEKIGQMICGVCVQACKGKSSV